MLDAERRALLSGDLAGLADYARAKEAQLAHFAAQKAGLRHAPRLLAALRRNQRLLECAMQGLAAARARLASQQALLQQMDTYGPKGRRTPIGQGQIGRIQKKL
ncbi:hypothetical protein PVT71_05760 [Salipiger sp. H15]|uniref:Flagellar biosynthesis protein FlgN n=1 Tax=Alloyangia sp. H15 TaxID=3029062 RepID=A0AAU8AK06_9RHOB